MLKNIRRGMTAPRIAVLIALAALAVALITYLFPKPPPPPSNPITAYPELSPRETAGLEGRWCFFDSFGLGMTALDWGVAGGRVVAEIARQGAGLNPGIQTRQNVEADLVVRAFAPGAIIVHARDDLRKADAFDLRSNPATMTNYSVDGGSLVRGPRSEGRRC